MSVTYTVPVPFSPVQPDPEYDFVAPMVPPRPKKGRQCGLCGAKFDYDIGYGYYCCVQQCPMNNGFGMTHGS